MKLNKLFGNISWASMENGSLTILDALRLILLLLVRYPLDDPRDVKSYEEAVSNLLGVDHVFALGAGRMALYLLLKVLDFESGSEIILPGLTCVVMPNAIRFAGHKPVYVDINMQDYNIDVDKIECAVTPRTRAILLQHTFGFPADIKRVREICKRRNLFLIEDGAHALGASYDHKPVGQWGDAVLFSTESSKMISTDKGGLLATNDPELAEKIKQEYEKLPIRSQAEEKAACVRLVYRIIRETHTFSNRLDYYYKKLVKQACQNVSSRDGLDFLGFDDEITKAELSGQFYSPYSRRLSGILSKAGLWQIRRLDKDIRNRKEKALLLESILSKYPVTLPVYDKEKIQPSFMNFPVLVENRDEWEKLLLTKKVRARGYLRDPLEPPTTTCHDINAYKWGSCPNAEYASKHLINIPLNRSLKIKMIKQLKHKPDNEF